MHPVCEHKSCCIKRGGLPTELFFLHQEGPLASSSTSCVCNLQWGWKHYCACRSGSISSCVCNLQWLNSLLCLQIRQRIFLCPQLWMGLTSSVPSLLKFYFCLSTTTLVCHHSFMHACYTEKERDAHCCSFFTFDKTKHDSGGGIDNNCLNCEWGDHNPFCTLGHTNPPPPPPAKDIRNQQGSSQQPSNVLLTLIEIADLFFTYSTAFW